MLAPQRFVLFLPVLLFLVLFICPAPARADSLVITGGSVHSPGTSLSRYFTFTGNGFAFTGSSDNSHSFCGPCSAGESINLSFLLSPEYSGPASIYGVDYAQLFYTGGMDFVSSRITLPLEYTSDLFTITNPFTVSGYINGFTISQFSSFGGDVFHSTVTGEGIVTLEVASYLGPNGRAYGIRNVSYDFHPSSPVPEPATLLLLGSGLGSLALKARRKRKGRKV